MEHTAEILLEVMALIIFCGAFTLAALQKNAVQTEFDILQTTILSDTVIQERGAGSGGIQ